MIANGVTIGGFLGVFLFCVLGLFHQRYRDNWFQHLGMIGMGIASVSAIHSVYHMDWVPTEMALFSVASFLFAAGTAFKVWQHRHNRQPPARPFHPLRGKTSRSAS